MSCKTNCCCNCKHLKEVTKHPMNTQEFSKGQMSETLGYVCIVPITLKTDAVVFFDAQHGMCELYDNKLK